MRRVATLFVAALMVTALFAPVATATTLATNPTAPTAPSVDAPLDADTAGDASFDTAADVADGDTTTNAAQDGDNDTDPTDEPIGCWEEICHDDELDIDQSDGLTEEELQALIHQSMARVEYFSDRKYREAVPVETMTREEYTELIEDEESNEEFNRWNDQVWKALFVVGEDDSSEDEIRGVFGGAVAGFYSPSADRIVIVVEEGEELRIDPATLLHELVHAMQDQYHDLENERYEGDTQDADLAVDGIVEGEAVLMEELYAERCENGEWECTDHPGADEQEATPPDLNWGVLLVVLHPYSDGPAYAHDLYQEGGWDAIIERVDNPPNSTSQVLHRDDDYETREVEFEDTAENGWETYSDQGVNGSDTVGEASIFSMFWYQNREYGAQTFDWQEVLLDTDHPHEQYNYAHEASDGWAGDELYPYRNDAGDEERDGYVWVIEWQTEADAEIFHDTYLRMLDAHGVERTADGVLHVEDGDFRGAYGIERDGTTVTIVHAPEPDDVFDIRPGIELDEPDDGTEEPDDGTEESDDNTTGSDDDTEESDDNDDAEEPNDDTDEPNDDAEGLNSEETPGFDIVAAVVAFVAAAAVAARRR